MGYSDISIAAAFFLGALHAFSPGHGKALVAAYLVSTRGTVAQAVYLGLIVAVTHTFSIILLGVIIKLAYAAIMQAVVQPSGSAHGPISVPGIKAIKLVAGVLILVVGVWIVMNRKRQATHEHHALTTDSRYGTWRLLLLGISGGMIPCAEGIAILLVAVASGQMGKGLVLVLFFSLGVAVTIVSIAVMICKLTALAERVLQRASGWVDKLPVVSGSLIAFLGLYSIVRVLISF